MSKSNKAEEQRLKMEYDIARTSTTSGVSARLVFLGFLITVNVAFWSGFYPLFKARDFGWVVVLSLVVLAIDVFVALIYVREHRAQEENHNQVWKIRERYNALMGSDKDPDWFIFKRERKTLFSGLTYKMTTCILSLFISLVLTSIFLVSNKLMPSEEMRLTILFFVLFFLVETALIALPDYDKK